VVWSLPDDGASSQGTRVRARHDENPAVATKHDILSIPTLLVFSEGQVVKKLVGAMPKKRLVDELSAWLG
jgi:thioredoxin 1